MAFDDERPVGAATVAGSIYLLLNSYKIFDGFIYTSVYLILVGAFSLFSLLLMAIGLKDHKKDSDRLYNRNMEESPLSGKKKVDESIFEEEPVVEIFEEKVEEPEAGSDALFEE